MTHPLVAESGREIGQTNSKSHERIILQLIGSCRAGQGFDSLLVCYVVNFTKYCQGTKHLDYE
jgi:hypothetical protein